MNNDNISLHLNLQNNLMLPQVPYEDGQKKEKLDVLDQMKMEEESTTSQMLQNSLELSEIPLQKKEQFVTQESVPIIKRKIWNDRSNYLKKNILTQPLSKTLVLDSIGNDQDLIPFWSTSTMEMSKNLWLPIETDCADLDSNLLTGSLKNMMLNSWFSVQVLNKKTSLENLQMTYLQSLQYLLPEITDYERDILNEKEQELNLKKENRKKQRIERMLQNETVEEKEKRLEKLKVKEANTLKKLAAKNAKIEKKKEKCLKENIEYIADDPKDSAGKSIKYNIRYSKQQKQTLRKWFGVRRWIYNQCITAYNSGYTTLQQLREKVIKNENYQVNNTWMLEYPFDLRDEALRDFLKNIKSNKAKENNQFQIHFKTRKEMSSKCESISVLSKHWNKKNNFYSQIFAPKNIYCTEKLPEKLLYDSRLMRTPNGKYYLCVPQPLEVRSDHQAPFSSMIFIDPGVKTFATCYDPSGKVFNVGQRCIERVARLLHYKNKLHSKISKEKRREHSRSMKKALLRLNIKVRNLVKDLHRRFAKWLCENYEYIYLPRLNFHSCKNLNKKSKAKMAALSHCSFSDLVKQKSREYEKCKFYEVNESFTSKTCSKCGYQNETLSNKDIYDCEQCNLKIGRDINGARNIMLRYFSRRAILRNS